MELNYNNKKSFNDIINNIRDVDLSPWNFNTNKIIHGDNLLILKALRKYNMLNNIDLIYIDPPFGTNNIFYLGNTTCSNSKENSIAYKDNIKDDNLIEFLRERLLLAYDLLSDKGSIYLHIDYKIGHYIKIIMDEIFGIENFHNDITRVKCNPKNFNRKSYGNIKDMILFYSKSKNYIWNEIYDNYTNEDIIKLFKKVDNKGRRYSTVPLHAPGETNNGETSKSFKGILPPKGRHWRTSINELEKLDELGLIEWSKTGNPRKIIYADEQKGKKKQDIWFNYKDAQNNMYPTEKNLELLKDIIKTSSNENSIILDFFCGSGTTLLASELLNRKYIGIDISDIAIKIAINRLKSNVKNLSDFDYIQIG